MNTRDKDNWCRYTKTLLAELGLEEHWDRGYEGTRTAWKQLVVNRIRNREEEEWRRRMQHKGRLRTYSMVKQKLQIEQYLDITEGRARRLILEFRSGVNQLADELDRRKGIPREQLLCELCRVTIEDELHVLEECKSYRDIREQWIRTIAIPSTYTRGQLLKEFLNCDNPKRCRAAGKYLKRLMERRELEIKRGNEAL